MTGPRCGEFLIPRVFKQNWSTGGDGEVRRHVLDHDLLLAAEAASDARLDHTNSLDRQSQHGRQHPPYVEGNLRGSPDHQAVILIPVGHDDMRLDRGLLDLGDFVLCLEKTIRRANPFSTSPMSMRIFAARFLEASKSAKSTYSVSS